MSESLGFDCKSIISICEYIGLDFKLIILFPVYFIIGIWGASANVFLELHQSYLHFSFRTFMKKWFYISYRFAVGGMIAAIFVTAEEINIPDNFIKSFFYGFAALAILQQIHKGKTETNLIHGETDNTLKVFTNESEKAMKEVIERLKKNK